MPKTSGRKTYLAAFIAALAAAASQTTDGKEYVPMDRGTAIQTILTAAMVAALRNSIPPKK